MSSLTVTDKLPIGVEVDGVRYRTFTLRPAKLRDSCVAAESLNADASEVYFETLARNAVFDGLDKDAIAGVLMGMYRRARDEAAGGASPNVLRYATIAQRISFEGLPQEKVTVDLLMDMFDRDAMVLERAFDDVEKKLDTLSSS
jgi:hypothetical protein